MVQNSRYLKIGPGGRRCNCCFPAPGSKDRRAQFRSAKRKADREAMKNAEADMIDHWATLAEELAKEYEDAYGDDYFFYDYDYWREERLQQEEDMREEERLIEQMEREYYANRGIGYYDYFN